MRFELLSGKAILEAEAMVASTQLETALAPIEGAKEEKRYRPWPGAETDYVKMLLPSGSNITFCSGEEWKVWWALDAEETGLVTARPVWKYRAQSGSVPEPGESRVIGQLSERLLPFLPEWAVEKVLGASDSAVRLRSQFGLESEVREFRSRITED